MYPFVVLLVLLGLKLIDTSYGISVTQSGLWSDVGDNYCNHFMCTPSNLTWKSDRVTYGLKSNVSACDALLKKGVRNIFFHGDSYMRQMYAAMLITLNGDYRYGSIANSTLSASCEYQKQFNEKNCGRIELNYNGKACNGTINLVPLLNELQGTGYCDNANGSVVLWSFGNHKVMKGFGLRFGINNATEYQKLFDREFCTRFKNMTDVYSGSIGPTNKCSIWWVSTHYRLQGWALDESAEQIQNYNEGMRHYFDSGGCGNVNYIDVYNMTRQLALHHLKDAELMTYDKVHWGMEVNLIKAQIIIDALLS